MKKTLLNLSRISVFALFAVNATGQSPTLTSSNFLPQIWESFTIHGTDYTSQGSAGANVTWDFSSLSSSASGEVDCLNLASTPYSTSFPNANIVESQSGAYSYYSTASSAWTCQGFVSPQGVVVTYSNPQQQMHFPFSYNSTFTDNFAGIFTSGVDFVRSGSVTVTSDAYGTLIMPYGTVNNVIRVHMQETYQDDYDAGGGPETIDYSTNTYIWYKEGTHHPVFNISVLVSSLQTVQGAFYLDASHVGINEIFTDAPEMNIYPNPTSYSITIDAELGMQNVELKIYNTQGQLVYQCIMSNEQLTIDVSDLSKGIYFLSVFDGEQQVNKKFIKE